MQKLKIITIGKLKNQNLKHEITQLTKRIKNLEILELKEIKEKNEQLLKQKEFQQIKPHIQNKQQTTFLLCEYGNQYSTFELNKKLTQISQNNPSETIQFIICGAFGPDEKLKQQLTQTLSLSKMIFTHEQALYMLIEQLYRNQCINNKIPYTK